jgi:uncharacterized membrane protein YheB (UPF0754 family)
VNDRQKEFLWISASHFVTVGGMELAVLIYIPFFTALIGWLTNKVAIKMLFRPRQPIRVLVWHWQGLIPRRQAEIAQRSGEIIERELLTQHFLRERIREIDLGPHLQTFAARLIREGIATRLQAVPLLGGFINDSTLDKLEAVAVEEMAAHAPELREVLADEAEKHLRVREYVEAQISGFDLDKLEEVVNQIASREFRTIEMLGGVLGFIVGLTQLALLWITGNLNL